MYDRPISHSQTAAAAAGVETASADCACACVRNGEAIAIYHHTRPR